jgi:hypothetical protein
MSIIATMILKKSTIKNTGARRLTADDIGADNFQKWQSAMIQANHACYRYKHAIDLRTHNVTVDVKAMQDTAYASVKAIFDLVGEVSDRDMSLDKALFEEFAKYSLREKTVLAGKALTVQSQIKNLENELDGAANGVSEEWLTAKQAELAEKEAEFKMLQKLPESGKDETDMATPNAFRLAVEKRLSKIIGEQSMKSAEQIDAERAAAKALKKAKRQAERQAAAKAREEAKKAESANK